MCEFKSGIILKSKCVIAEGNEDSHTTLLEKLKIDDTEINARRRFVRAELLPPDKEWWTDPATWTFYVDQDILPEWYTNDPGKYEQMFREAVTTWTEKHIIIKKELEELSEGYYLLNDSTVKRLSGTVNVLMYDSTVDEMTDSSIVWEMRGNSTVNRMRNNSSVQEMYNKSTVKEMCDESVVLIMRDNSTVQEMYDNSVVEEMCGNSIAVNEEEDKLYTAKSFKYEIEKK